MKSPFCFGVLLLASTACLGKDEGTPLVTDQNVPGLTRLLEEQPLHPQAREIRALMLAWEDKSKSVVDVVCPGALKPLPSHDIKYSSELLAQFIFGSAAYQLEHPADKGKLLPSQVAGMHSLLRAYQSLLAADPTVRVPRLDELSGADAKGVLEEVMKPLVAKECSTSH